MGVSELHAVLGPAPIRQFRLLTGEEVPDVGYVLTAAQRCPAPHGDGDMIGRPAPRRATGQAFPQVHDVSSSAARSSNGSTTSRGAAGRPSTQRRTPASRYEAMTSSLGHAEHAELIVAGSRPASSATAAAGSSSFARMSLRPWIGIQPSQYSTTWRNVTGRRRRP